MNETGASPKTIARQVARQGKRWGIVPVINDQGDVKACQKVRHLEVRGGLGATRIDTMPICTVDEDAPFSSALNCRVRDGETDLAARYKLHDRLERARLERQSKALEDEIRSVWATRNRITMLPGGIVLPSGLAAREEFRRRNYRR